MLLDAASLYFRSFHGIPDSVQAPDGSPVNAVRGFLDTIAYLVTLRRPERLVACWDEDWRPAFRVAAIPSYKAHRVANPRTGAETVPELLSPQIPVIIEALELLGIARAGAAGFEADDVIGTLTARELECGGGNVDVVTGDRDLFQLANDAGQVRVLYVGKGVRNLEVVDEAWLAGKYGVLSGQGYADLAVLRGDPSDGLPGVAGIGEKTAVGLLSRFGDLAGVRAAALEPPLDLSPASAGNWWTAATWTLDAPRRGPGRARRAGSRTARRPAADPARPRGAGGVRRALGPQQQRRPRRSGLHQPRPQHSSPGFRPSGDRRLTGPTRIVPQARGGGQGRGGMAATTPRLTAWTAASRRAYQSDIVAGLRDLAEQVDDLLAPADEVAGGQVGVAQHRLQRLARGPAVDRPGQAEIRLGCDVQFVLAFLIVQLGPDPGHLVQGQLRGALRHPGREPALVPAGLVDDRAHHGGQPGDVEVAPDPPAQALADQQVGLG